MHNATEFLNTEVHIGNSAIRIVSNEQPYQKTTTELEVRIYRRRWVVLACFCLVAGANAAQWIQYSIIANVIMKYYNISALMVDNTSLIYMITYVPLIFPATYIMDKRGLRYSTIIASFGTALGSWIKVASASPDRFYVTFIGQSVCSVVQMFILSVPSRLAATWFAPDQVSSACSLGVFGTFTGIAIGFVVPPMVVRNHENLDDIGADLFNLFLIQAIFNSIVTLAVLAFFQKQPPLAPSSTQALQREQPYSNKEFKKTFKRLFKNPAYIALLVAYGISVGVYNVVSTLLNQCILLHFPDSQEFAGSVGLTIVVTGIFGSIIFGIVLDKTRRFKETTFIIYLLTACGMAAYTFSLGSQSKILVYLSSAMLGTFMSGYMPVGFELCAELTYPEPETTSAGLLVASAQLLGVLFTLVFGVVVSSIGDFWANAGMFGLLIIGTVITAFTPNYLRRQHASKLHCQYSKTNNVET